MPGWSAALLGVASLIGALLAAPRMQTMGGPVELEAGTKAAELAEGLRALGHKVRVMPVDSGFQAIANGPDGMTGGADPRREGVAVGE